jgi:hypothetical protein
MMYRKLFLLTCFVLVLGLAGNAPADMHWDGEAGPGDPNWSTALNWAGNFGDPNNTVPGATTIVRPLMVPGYGPTIANPGAVAGGVIVGDWGWAGELTVTSSGDLTTDANYLIIANQSGYQGDVSNEGTISVVGDIYVGNNGDGTLTNSGTINTAYLAPYNGTIIVANNAGSTGIMTNTGDVNVGYWMYVGLYGDGLLNMNGGTIDVPNGNFCIGTLWNGTAIGPGHVNFHGGVVTTSGLTLNGTGSCTADFTEGVLLTAACDAGGIRWLADVGHFTAYGGKGRVMVDEYNLDPNYITVWGVNEPSADLYWDGGAGAGDPNWNVATNWNTDTVPTSGDFVAAINTPGYGPTIANTGAVAGKVDVGIPGWNGELTITPSGDLTVVYDHLVTKSGNLIVGKSVGTTGVVVNEGTIDVGGEMYVGENGFGSLTNSGTINTINTPYTYTGTIIVATNAGSTGVMTNTGDVNVDFWMYVGFNGNGGVLNMDGGTIDVPNGNFSIGTLSDGTPAGPGHVNFHGGTVTVNNLVLNGTGSCTADFTEGVLLTAATGDVNDINSLVNGINFLASVGHFTAYGGSGTVMVDYNNVNPGYITVWGVEPSIDVHWDGGAGASEPNWNVATNWNTDLVPTSANSVAALVVPGYGPTIANTGAVAERVDVGILDWDGELTVTSSGGLTVVNDPCITGSGDLVVAHSDGETGVLVNEGSIDVGGHMYVGLYGDGLLNMDGGTIDVNDSFCIGMGAYRDYSSIGTGHVNFHGGTVTAGNLALSGVGNCTADFTTGVLIADGNHTEGIGNLTDAMYWTAYGGWDVLQYDYDITTPNATTVWATDVNYSSMDSTTVTWKSSSISNRWHFTPNWYRVVTEEPPLWANVIPRSVDKVRIPDIDPDGIPLPEPNRPVIVKGITADANQLFIGDASTGTSYLTMTGGTLNVTSFLFIGAEPTDGQLNISGGTINTASMNVGDASGIAGHVQLDGGSITANSLTMDSNGTMDITGGMLILSGDQRGVALTYKASGQLTAYGGSGNMVVWYDSSAGNTSVAATLCPVGDISGNCVVDMEDLRIFAEQWLEDAGGCSGTNCADLDWANGVNFSDFALLANNWLADNNP